MQRYLFTSESLTEGQPDKILDAIIIQDKNLCKACETTITTIIPTFNIVFI